VSTIKTTSRVLHDLGGAVWLGGSLMGAVGLNGASAHVSDPNDRLAVTTAGWARWAPVSGVAVGAHLLGGLGVLLTNRDRAAVQPDVRVNTIAKLALTATATAATIWSGALGAKLAASLVQDKHISTQTGVIPTEATPVDVAATQRQLRALQWLIPATMGVVMALSAQQGEQQAADAASPIARSKVGVGRLLRQVR